MVPWVVIFSFSPSRAAPSRRDQRFPPCRKSSLNFHGIISFADPHSLTLLESHRFKNIGVGGRRSDAQFALRVGLLDVPPSNRSYMEIHVAKILTGSGRSDVQTLHIHLSPSDATLIHLPASVANKRLTSWLNPLDDTY